MSDSKRDEGAEAPEQNNRNVVYLLGVVAVLLVVIVALVIIKSQGTTAASTDTAATQQPTLGSSMPGVGSSTQAQFDPKTATKVPASQKPADFVKAYYQAILDKAWAKAFKMQPATSQQGATAEQFGQTQEQYGMKSFKVTSATEQGDTATVVVTQDLGSNGKWGATWTFVKDGKTWLVQKRQVSMNP